MKRKRKREIQIWLDESDMSSESSEDLDNTDDDPDFRVEMSNSEQVRFLSYL